DRALRLRLRSAADRLVDEHRLDRCRVVQLAEDRLKLPEALGKRFDALGRKQRGEELDGIAQFLEFLAQLVPHFRIQGLKSAGAFADLLPALAERALGELGDWRCQSLGLAKILGHQPAACLHEPGQTDQERLYPGAREALAKMPTSLR